MATEVELLDCEIEETEVFEEPGEVEVDDDAEETKIEDLVSNKRLGDAKFDVEVDSAGDEVARVSIANCEEALEVNEFTDLLRLVGTLLLIVLEHVAEEEPEVPTVVLIGSPDVVDGLAPTEIMVVKKMELV
ncbi:hypothetical protein BOTCAL_0180g00150 [Botryotinia calthae]|uniref:Uncharacterized protein n=1 Tax=Botryotinia calthae TaxID=38488 RepID=A0A4Y8D380_9HELO|nr:hypothetical protein BOTCAL_0180g00150 [Botryotinia calthae]